MAPDFWISEPRPDQSPLDQLAYIRAYFAI